jgi:hypothetical protein
VPDLNPCDHPWLKDTPLCETANAVKQSIDFASDPLGYIAQKMQEASAGLANTVLPALEKLTHPQLNTEWFVGAYQVTFALAVFFWVALLAWNFFLLARRRISGDDVFDTLVYYTPLFFVGSTFGPALGVFVLSFIGALNDSLVQWGIVGSVQATTSKLQAAIAAGSPGSIVGGSLVAIILFAAMIVALLLTFIVLLVMLVTLYLTGAVFPMSLVWVNHPRRRGRGLKILYVWVGVLFSHVLVFFLLGLAFRMVAGMSLDVGGGALQALTNIAIAVIVLLMATLSPVALAAFAPIGPTDSGGAGGITAPSGGGRRSGFSGVESEDDSQLAQLTRSSEGVSTPTDGDDDDRSNGQGRLMTRVRQMQAEGTGKAPSSTSIEGGAATPSAAAPDGVAGAPGTSSPGLTQPVPATAGVGGGGGGGTPTGLPVGGPAGSGPASGGPAGGGPAIGAAARGAPGAGAGAGEAASAVGVGGAAGAAGEGVAAAGAGAAATGIGAPVGAVLIGAGIAVGKAVEVAQEAGDIAAEHMDHRQEDHDADPHPRW